MGKGGFTLIESGSVMLNANTDMIADFQLPDDYPDNLMTFLQISLSVSDSSIIRIQRDGIFYPINNNEPLIGEVYRSIPIIKGEIINVQFLVNQALLKFKFSLEE